jgi:Flp pilus assembly protein TadG
MTTMNRHLKRVFRRFGRDDKGAVALIFALALVPVIGMTGAAIDYNRGSQLRARMATASDAAVLAAVKAGNVPIADRERIAEATFRANLGVDASLSGVSGNLTRLAGNSWRFTATGTHNYAMLSVVPFAPDSGLISVVSEANSGEGSVEVALVLDNTGSMVNDMGSLRQAARDFTNTLFNMSAGGAYLKMSVVPYVASVNPGRLNLGMSAVDTRGDGEHHARNLRWRWIGFIPNCNNDPFWVPGPGGPWTPGPGPGTPGDGAWLQDAFRKLGNAAGELFGVKSAAAQVGTYGTPNRTAPFTGTTITINRPYTNADGVQALVPNGFNHDMTWSRCVLQNPGKISNLDLFDGIRLRGGARAQWKGCVEARPEPFDVTDDPPNPADPRTLFVPYFWPDEPGASSRGRDLGYVNNYMDDGSDNMPTGWNAGWEWEWQSSILKYDGVDRNAQINETAPNTRGPNMACPDELLRLTSNKDQVLAKVNGLKHWNGGGTVSSEGVAWGWRTLSPRAPFADGAAYGVPDNKKVLVIMTDGENLIGGNKVDGPVMSQYNAYGYLRWGRFGAENFDVASDYLDNRMRTVCTNAKNAGVQVITILFRTDTARSRNLLRDCASSGRLFYLARNQDELQQAFAEVAQQIGKIRLTK